MSDRLYFRQLLSGRDFAVGDTIATQMKNFVYLIGDRETRQAVVVDPAYAVDELLDLVLADEMKLVGVLASHHHPDHVGGDLLGFQLAGIAQLLERDSVPIHVNQEEAQWVRRATGVSTTDLIEHGHDDVLQVGSIPLRFLHTPGHTPGSQCFLVDGKLISGDTLFLESCGRTDFPGGDTEAMYHSLHRLTQLSDNPIVYPGHHYSVKRAAHLTEVQENNHVFHARSLPEWRSMFG
jgi:glyoxylase-like metal-dependent hydrolase (beta-lactamase superfamily II)